MGTIQKQQKMAVRSSTGCHGEDQVSRNIGTTLPKRQENGKAKYSVRYFEFSAFKKRLSCME